MAKQLQISDFIRESKGSKLQTLNSGDVISVFHGTDFNNAYEFALNGFDATVRKGRTYPHTVDGKQVDVGLYVSPGMQTAREFGPVVIKFKTDVKNLQAVFPGMEDQERESLNKGGYFTKSSRPEVTDRLVNDFGNGWDSRKGGYAGREQQARFVGIVSPRAIERIYLRPPKWKAPMTSMSREEFLQYCEASGYKPKHSYKKPIEPQETFTSLDEFVKAFSSERAKNSKIPNTEQERHAWLYLDRLHQQYPGMSAEEAAIDIGSTFGSLPPSVAKNVGVLFVKHYGSN